MSDDPITDEIRTFILKHIDSVAHMEALLLLRENATRWDVTGVAKRLYIDEAQAREILERLCADGLLSCEAGQFSYTGLSEDRRALVDRLAQAYSRHLIPVTNLIHAKPRRIREFADAFRFRKGR